MAHRLENAVDECFVLEELVDAAELRLHQLLGVWRPEENRVPERPLAVATTKHRDF
jgi:hypothetical protein